ncbi:hypothetical protein N9L68_05220 [bacterium]|nr:hypothetical protein [bacterium]
MMGDTLHTLYLGVFQVVAAYAFRFIADNNVFRAPDHYSAAGKFEHNLALFERALKKWYQEAERRDPHRKITQIDGFTVGMVKTEKKGRPKMQTKAAECKWLSVLLSDFITEKSRDNLLLVPWAETARNIVAHIRVMDDNPWRISHEAHRDTRCMYERIYVYVCILSCSSGSQPN